MHKLLENFKKACGSALDLVFVPSRLEKMTPEEFAGAVCPCEETPETISVLFSYRDPLVKRAIWELKFRGNRKIAKLFAEILYEEILAEVSELSVFYGQNKAIIVPLPSHPKRLKEKGFNQTELIANHLSFIGCGSFEVCKNVLYKIKDTPAQFSIKDRTERLNNQKDAFAVRNAENVDKKIVILIDDVVTTGATLKEAKKALKKAGAKKIICFALAH